MANKMEEYVELTKGRGLHHDNIVSAGWFVGCGLAAIAQAIVEYSQYNPFIGMREVQSPTCFEEKETGE